MDGAGGATLPTHGTRWFADVEVDSYSLKLEDAEGFAGDKANKEAFVQILDELRKPLAKLGEDPLGPKRSDEFSRKRLAGIIAEGDPPAAALVQGAVEKYAQQLQAVIRRFLKLKAWRDTQSISVGGGLRSSRVGEVAIARAAQLLKADEVDVEVQAVHNSADEAGLIGAVHLLPAWMLQGHDAMLAADIGGTNLRAGIVKLRLSKAKDLSKASVADYKRLSHAERGVLSRAETVDQLVEMLTGLAKEAKKQGLSLAPLVGIGCPGIIREDGSIERGAHNLPGDWQSGRFNLPLSVRERMPRVGGNDTIVLLHNDAVVQGLSEIPYMRDRRHWGVLTIGTGLGNARFSRRERRKVRRDRHRLG